MAIQGLGYTKTTWAFEERPVASAKLNQWDDRIETALEIVYFLLGKSWGGRSGVLRGAAEHDLKVESTPTPGLSVRVQPGYALINNLPYRLNAITETGTFVVPSLHNRIDLVQACLPNWNIAIKPGTESASPTAPAPDSGCIALATVLLRPGMSIIKTVDDSVNGYIVDTRPFA
ncbi:MAG: hypothetical protein HYV27_19260 [Candidatus Hydrogenedentes bacterium]|nr:hypothetical protein [Candidatus Hydrogenedentota bacterium]